MAGTNQSGRPSEKHQLVVLGEQSPPPMPSDLIGDHAQELWAKATESLAHVLRGIDYAILKQCCQAFQIGQDAFEKGNAKLALAAFRQYENHAKQIGLTPSSRRIVKAVQEPAESQSDAAVKSWLARGGLN
jgi:phage terminase small subunit